jgi:RNA polymerase sigma factor (sigma-70 family)
MPRMREEAQSQPSLGSERGSSSGLAPSRSTLADTGIRRVWDKTGFVEAHVADAAPVSELRITPRPHLTVMRHLSVVERIGGLGRGVLPTARAVGAVRHVGEQLHGMAECGTIQGTNLSSMLKVVDGGGVPAPQSNAPRLDPLGILARRATEGDEAAMRQLLRSVAGPLLAAVKAIAGRRTPDLEDIAQETLVAFVQALPAFRGECSVMHYASRIAVRTAMAARRRRAARDHRLDALDDSEPEEQLAVSPGEEAWAAKRRELLRVLLDELPEVQADTLALRVALGYSMQEVADATSAPVNTVRSRLRLAKEALRRRIEQDPALSDLMRGET